MTKTDTDTSHTQPTVLSLPLEMTEADGVGGKCAASNEFAQQARDDQAHASKDPPALPDFLMLDPEQCYVSDFNGRDRSLLTSDALSDLFGSISGIGVVEPILVLPPDPASGRYPIIAGARRHAVVAQLKLAGRDDLRLPAVVRDASELDAVAMSDAENSHRRELSAYDRGRAFKRAIDDKIAQTQKELARKIGQPEPRISELIGLAGWPPEVLDAYGSPHAVLAVDAQRLNKWVAEARDEITKAAAIIVRERDRTGRQLPRAAVTRRLLEAVEGTKVQDRELRIVTSNDKPIISVTRRTDDAVSLRLYRRAGIDERMTKVAFGRLLQALDKGQRGPIEI